MRQYTRSDYPAVSPISRLRRNREKYAYTHMGRHRRGLRGGGVTNIRMLIFQTSPLFADWFDINRCAPNIHIKLKNQLKMDKIQRLAFCAVLCQVLGVVLSVDKSYYKPGMRVKWGAVNNTADRGREFFFDIALTASQAESRDGWVAIPPPKGTRYATRLSMRCPANDFTCCAFYDEYDYFAGLQISVPVNGITNPVPADQRITGAILWSAPAKKGGVAQDYWSNQLFIVNGESLKKTKKEREALRAAKNTLLYNDALWISDTDYYSNTKLRQISDIEAQLPREGYFRQGCFEGMGRHHYYELLTRRSCTNTDPWFPLTSSGGNQFHGIGFILQAIFPDPAQGLGLRTWFEHQTVAGIKLVTPDVAKCELDLTAVDNLRTIHIYFISEPWKITCTDENDFKRLGLDS